MPATAKGFLGECLMLTGQTAAGKNLIAESYERRREKSGANHEQTQLAFARLDKLQ